VVRDPVHRAQLYVRAAGQLLRGPSPETKRRDALDEAERERIWSKGEQEVADLLARIEAHTGSKLESPRALDYGCGMGRMVIPLAKRCEHVYGLDVVPAVLQEADSNAKRMHVGNVEWMEAGRLPELSGSYDLVISQWVFQHIPSREGERIFATLLAGLRPGGVGAIHVTLRPDRPLAGMFRWSRMSGGFTFNPFKLVRRVDWSYPYMLMNSYSLNRLGNLLSEAGVTEWHTKWHHTTRARAYDAVTLIFRKG
jgi:cyclopropane fatty-acyl-phospholipid synthase-like methyltransferase